LATNELTNCRYRFLLESVRPTDGLIFDEIQFLIV